MVLLLSLFSRSLERQFLVREISRKPKDFSQLEPAFCFFFGQCHRQEKKKEYPIQQPAALRCHRRHLAVLQQQRRWLGNQAIQLPKSRAQPSMRLQAGDRSDVLRDIGLLPDTFIPLSKGNRPSLFKEPRVRWELFRRRVTYRVKNLVSLIVYRWYMKSRIQYFKPAKLSVDLFISMYESLAEGNTSLLRQICADGLYESFKARIQARGRNKMSWRMHGLVDRPRVVSNSAVILDPTTGFRQAVVKIQSLQSITQYDPQGKAIPGTGKVKPVREYVVLQKRKTKSGEGDWIVWGTTEETTLDILRHRESTSPFKRA